MQTAAQLSPISATVRLQFTDVCIDVETNSLRLASRLQSYFGDYLAQAGDPAHTRLRAIVGTPEYDASRMVVWTRASNPDRLPKESFYDDGATRRILKNRTGVLITLDPHGASITGALDDQSNQVVNLTGTLFGIALMKRGYAMVHASAVVDQRSGSALVFLGNSGSGKSSVALQLIERGGFAFLSNDRVLMLSDAAGVRVVGLPKKPRVNPGTLLASTTLSRLVPATRRHAYEQLSKDELWRLEEKTDVDVGQQFGARSQLTAPLGRIYSLGWRTAGEGLSEAPLDVDASVAALQATAKDFGPYDLGAPVRDVTPEFRRIAVLVPFIAVTGKAEPKRLASAIAQRS